MVRFFRSGMTGALVLVAGMTVSATALQAAEPKRNYTAQNAFMPILQRVSSPAAASAVCQTYAWACARSAQHLRITSAHMPQIDALNRQINRSVRQISDMAQYGREDVWALPTARGGDCEDIALLKKKRLIEMGIPPQQLLIATALDRRRQGHAVLILRTEQGDMVLDNLTKQIRRWDQTGYSFMRIQDPSSPSRWAAVMAGGVFKNATTAATRH